MASNYDNRWELVTKNKGTGRFFIFDYALNRIRNFQMKDMEHVEIVGDSAYVFLSSAYAMELDLNTGEFSQLL